jgi:hypothetical protein
MYNGAVHHIFTEFKEVHYSEQNLTLVMRIETCLNDTFTGSPQIFI